MEITKGIKPEFADIRGAITKILDDGRTNIKSVLLITSKKGAIRANHYHKKDTHYCYMLSGKMEYFEKPVPRSLDATGIPAEGLGIDGGKIESAVLEVGDMVFTPSMHVHAFKFLEDTVWVTLATESRSQADYEADTVRVKFIE